MMLEGHSCWENCDEGPHACICGNECAPPEARYALMIDELGVPPWPPRPKVNARFTRNW